jgi:hypothetical protein
MQWETPEIHDLGTIAEHTFVTPSGSHKGTVGHDPHGEISAHS